MDKIRSDPQSKAALEQVRLRLQAFYRGVQLLTAQQKAAMQSAEQTDIKKIGEMMADVSALHCFDKLDEVATKYPELASSIRELQDAWQQFKQAREESQQELDQRFAHIADGMDSVLKLHIPAFDDPTFWDNIQPIGEQIREAFRDALAERDQCKARTLPHGDAEQNGPFMPAAWFRDKFGIPAQRLRAARRDGRLHVINVGTKRPCYRYSVCDAMRLWPDDGIHLPDESV